MENSEQEKVFFKDKNVTVTQSRFIANEKTYAMRNISSVSNNKLKKSRAIPIILVALGVLLYFSGSKTFSMLMAIIGGVWI